MVCDKTSQIVKLFSELFVPNTPVYKFLQEVANRSKCGSYILRSNDEPLIQVDRRGATVYTENIPVEMFISGTQMGFIQDVIKQFSAENRLDLPVFLELSSQGRIRATIEPHEGCFIPLGKLLFRYMSKFSLNEMMVLVYSFLKGMPILAHPMLIAKILQKEDAVYVSLEYIDGSESDQYKVHVDIEPKNILGLFTHDRYSLVSRMFLTWTTEELLKDGFQIEIDLDAGILKSIKKYKEGRGKVYLKPFVIELTIDGKYEVAIEGEQYKGLLEFLSDWLEYLTEAYSSTFEILKKFTAKDLVNLYLSYKALPEDIRTFLDDYRELSVYTVDKFGNTRIEKIAGLEVFVKHGTLVKPGYEGVIQEFFVNKQFENL